MFALTPFPGWRLLQSSGKSSFSEPTGIVNDLRQINRWGKPRQISRLFLLPAADEYILEDCYIFSGDVKKVNHFHGYAITGNRQKSHKHF